MKHKAVGEATEQIRPFPLPVRIIANIVAILLLPLILPVAFAAEAWRERRRPNLADGSSKP